MPPEKPSFLTQAELFRSELVNMINLAHPLVKLADRVRWSLFDQAFEPTFCPDNGRKGCWTRLMVGLHYLKHLYDFGDEALLEQWVENPYWQYFCGMKYFQHEAPVDASSMTRWRQRFGEAGAEKLLAETIRVGVETGVIKLSVFQRVNVDTTVQEKNVRFPTDARLLDRMREHVVREAQTQAVELRQSYRRVGKKLLAAQARYAHARQVQRAEACTRKLKTILGRVVRDVRRKIEGSPGVLVEKLALADRLLRQRREDHDKLYSIHEPQVECICKGKAHRRYEFGCKVSVASSSRGNWVVGLQALHGNPYDGHTLRAALAQIRRVSGIKPKEIFCDQGYRGHGISQPTVHLVARRRRGIAPSLLRWMRRRAAIEPIIGHIKSDHRMERNRLKGVLGDQINAILSGAAFNLKKLLRAFLSCLKILLSLSILTPNPSPPAPQYPQ